MAPALLVVAEAQEAKLKDNNKKLTSDYDEDVLMNCNAWIIQSAFEAKRLAPEVVEQSKTEEGIRVTQDVLRLVRELVAFGEASDASLFRWRDTIGKGEAEDALIHDGKPFRRVS